MSQSRQLAAIMFTDIVGYTALMGRDEQKAFELLKKNRLIHKPLIENFNGRFIKELGDGVLASFNTVSDAVHTAIAIQHACNETKDLQLRIGIHLGEITFEDNDVFGDGVNIASRLQGIAAPGGIYISESVYENVVNKKDIQTVALGKYSLKNVKEPIAIFAVSNTGLNISPPNLAKHKSGEMPATHFLKKQRVRIIKWVLPLFIIGVAAVFILPGWMNKQRARNKIIPQIKKLLETDFFATVQAFNLAKEAEKYIPHDTALLALWPLIAQPVSMETIPKGADVYWKDYNDTSNNWIFIATTPFKNVWFPGNFLNRINVKIEKKGFETIYSPQVLGGTCPLDSSGKLPINMVRAKGFKIDEMYTVGLGKNIGKTVNDFLADRYEITNKQFKEFVNAGGYREKKYWDTPFYKEGKEISWESAMALFTDKTGRAGPASWEAGSFPNNKETHPVTGVSWYEAMAYAKFAGKQLPTIFHWRVLNDIFNSQHLVAQSNFNSLGTLPVGTMHGLSTFGLYDIAGNAREWQMNEANKTGRRIILGGGWNDVTYAYNDANAQEAFDRSLSNGFRCIKLLPGDTSWANLSASAFFAYRDYNNEKPVSDEMFSVIQKQFSYDARPFNEKAGIIVADSDYAKVEKIEIDATYNKERIIFYLYLPKNVSPPYQAFLFFNGSSGIYEKIFKADNFNYKILFDFLLKNGRAVIFPVYKGTYERSDELHSDLQDETVFYKDHVISWVHDSKRILDYIDTRKDIQKGGYGFYGFSWGSAMGPIICASEKRFKVAVLHAGGLMMEKALPEVDAINYLPRMTVPTLMLNGKNDGFYPVETSQKPMYNFLGTPEKDKKRLVYESGHGVPRPELIKESLAWFDKYMVPEK